MTVNALVFFNFFLAKEFYTVLSDCCSESVLFSADRRQVCETHSAQLNSNDD